MRVGDPAHCSLPRDDAPAAASTSTIPGASTGPGVPGVSDAPDLESTSERTIIDLRGAGPFVSVGHYRYLAAQDALPMQVHSRLLVLAFAVRSRFDFVVNDSVVGVEPSEAILIPPGNTYSTGLRAQTRGELVWLVLHGETGEPARQSEWPDIRQAVADLHRHGVGTFRSPRLAVDLLSRVLESADVSWPGTAVWRESLCSAALVELWRGLSEALPSHDPVHPGLRRAVAWAAANIEGTITAGDLVAVSGISRAHFYELFVETFGTSPKDHILRAKIERATDLLRSSSISVTDIAHRLGFSSSQHFGTAFRRYLGMSPSAFRSLLPTAQGSARPAARR